MDNLEVRKYNLLHDFEEFEREFLPPYDPRSETDLNLANKRSWIAELEQNFVSNQLSIRKTQLSGFDPPVSKKLKINLKLSCQIYENSDFSPPQLQDMDFESSPNQTNFLYNPLIPDLDSESPDQTSDTVEKQITGSPHSNLVIPHRTQNMNPTNEENLCDMINFDDIQFDLSVLDMIDFDIPTSPHMEIDKTAYVNKANTEYGEEFAKKVEKNLRILEETMKRTRKCCNVEEGEKGVCCKGKCWRYTESKLRALQNLPRGRKKKGFELTPEQISLRKERQKIKNRISAATAYRKDKVTVNMLMHL